MSDFRYTPIGDMPSAAYQGEVASHGGNTPAFFVSPGIDLAAKVGSNQDSWFLTSHLETSRGVIDLLAHYLHVVPMSGGEGYLAVMVSTLEAASGTYRSEELAFPGEKCTFNTRRCEVVSPVASCSGDTSALRWVGTWDQAEVSFDLTVAAAGPMLANMGGGLWPALGGITYHYALPTMTTDGTITIAGESLEVSGNSWLDRQWGTTPRFFIDTPKKWVWFGVCLDNGVRISVWEMNEGDLLHTFATVLHPSGRHEVVSVEPLIVASSEPWTSPETGRTYPTRWNFRIPQADAEMVVQAQVQAQEFRSPVGNHKYEASAPVTGTLHGEPISGYAVIELVGDWARP